MLTTDKGMLIGKMDHRQGTVVILPAADVKGCLFVSSCWRFFRKIKQKLICPAKGTYNGSFHPSLWWRFCKKHPGEAWRRRLRRLARRRGTLVLRGLVDGFSTVVRLASASRRRADRCCAREDLVTRTRWICGTKSREVMVVLAIFLLYLCIKWL